MLFLDKKCSFIFLLPSEAKMAIIQTEPSLNLTCLLPPTRQEIQVDYHPSNDLTNVIRGEVDVPALLWTQLFLKWNVPHLDESDFQCNCFKCTFSKSMEHQWRDYKGSSNFFRFFIHAIDFSKSTDSTIIAAPFTMANNDDGYVCWGGILYPYSLLKAHVDYWQSIHNNSPNKYPLKTYGSSHREINEELLQFMQQYKPKVWKDYSSLILGKKYYFVLDVPNGILISLDPQLQQLSENKKAFVGFAYKTENIWKIKLNNIELDISSDILVQ